MAKYKIEREYIFSGKSYKEMCEFLNDYGDLDLFSIRDEKGNTALHQCAYTNELKMMRKYLEITEKRLSKANVENPTTSLLEFINAVNNDGYTALHFAAYKGHYKILEELQKNGANVQALTPNGQNVLHLAAQGDKVETFIFFESFIDLNSKDSKQSTPLHWASYMNSESIVIYLLAEPGINVNALDSSNQTPLHLATAYGNTKIVKRLLRAGADRKILNKKKQTALKIARDNEFRNIEKILDDEYRCIDYLKICMNLKTEYKPQKRSSVRPIIFLILMTLLIFCRFFFFEMETGLEWVQYVEGGIELISMLLFISLLFRPAKLKQSKYINFLNGGVEIKKICLICIAEKPNRSFHCDICCTCIERYDHHCYWINNCVGKFNLKKFIVFINLLFVFMLYSTAEAGIILYNTINKKKIFIFVKAQFSDQADIIGYSYSGVNILLSAIFMIPIFALIVVQCKNLLLNRTTYERFTKDKISTFTESSSHLVTDHIRKKKRRRYSIANAKTMCFDQDELNNGPTESSKATDSLLNDYS